MEPIYSEASWIRVCRTKQYLGHRIWGCQHCFWVFCIAGGILKFFWKDCKSRQHSFALYRCTHTWLDDLYFSVDSVAREMRGLPAHSDKAENVGLRTSKGGAEIFHIVVIMRSIPVCAQIHYHYSGLVSAAAQISYCPNLTRFPYRTTNISKSNDMAQQAPRAYSAPPHLPHHLLLPRSLCPLLRPHQKPFTPFRAATRDARGDHLWASMLGGN